MILRNDVTREALGRWPEIHQAAGIPPEYLRLKKGQPCPACGGTDRYHYSDREGRGTYLCRKCGGGDGFSLLMKYHGWDFARAADEVRLVLGIDKNLCRSELTSTEQAEHLAKRKELWEAREQKAAQVAPKLKTESNPKGAGRSDGFASDTAKSTGRDKSTINRALKRANEVCQEARAPTYPKAMQIWNAATWTDEYTASHPYAIRKGITHAAGAARGTATGKLIGQDADCIVVPMRTLEGELTGVECINLEGVKQTFGNKGVLILGNDLDPTLPQLVVEGWATAVAILNLYRWNACVYACFGKGMLSKLAAEVASKYPERQVIIAGESDA